MADERQHLTDLVTALQPSVIRDPVELVVTDGPDTGKRVSFLDEAVRIGTANSNELRLTDQSVSRLHAVVKRGDHRLVIEDVGSTNGTFVSGVRVRDADLEPGMHVRVGRVDIAVVALTPTAVRPLPDRKAFGPLVGGSLPMRRIYATIEKVAPTDTTVLILGETGTGKEVVARALHEASARASGPFLAVDCGALAESLVESELFGHRRGAFTGADSSREGAFQAARGGTLFFDEVGELPAALQRRFLRVLETRQVRPVGSDRTVPVDVRVIAATNRHLGRAVNEGWFREDLYYRLAVVSIEMPPLRERRADIPGLATHFLRQFGSNPNLPPDVLTNLMTREWPGNVRELRNYIERSVAVGWEPSPGQFEDTSAALPRLADIIALEVPLKDARERWVDAFERAYVDRMLERCGGNVTQAAKRAKVSRRFLQRTIARLKR